MADRLEKFLRRIEKTKRLKIERVIRDIMENREEDLDIKKLKGCKGLYRVRIGNIRIVYFREESNIVILFIGKRSDTMYKKLKEV